MKKEQIMDIIKGLAKSQGFYSRLYRNLTSDKKGAEEFLTHLEKQNFKSAVDLVIYLES